MTSSEWTAAVWALQRGSGAHGSAARSWSPEAAMSLTTVQACIALVAGKLATLPLYVTDVRRKPDEPPVREELPFWLEQPDPEMTREDTITQMVSSLMTDGNAYALVTSRYYHGEPSSIKVLHPTDVTLSRPQRDGRLEYRVNGALVDREDMVHVRGMMYPGSDIGVGPITYGARLVGAALHEAEYVARRFDDKGFGAAVPDGVIESPNTLTQQQSKDIDKQVNAAVGGLRRGVLILDGGLHYKQLQFSAREMELIASRKYTNVELCSMMQVPAHLVNVQTENSMTYSNVRNDMIALAAFGLENWSGKLAAGLSRSLLPRGKKLVFDLDDLFRRLWMMVGTQSTGPDDFEKLYGPDSELIPAKMAAMSSDVSRLKEDA